MRSRQFRRRNKPTVVRLLTVVCCLIVVTGAGLGLYQYVANRSAAAHVAKEVDRANHGLPSSLPSTTKPDDDAFAKYQVAPDAPRYIYIPTISVKAMVKPMGLTKDNSIEAPGNVHDAGWFTQSAKPGQTGATILDGHVANWATLSVFHDLYKLQAGDVVTIERGDGKRVDYQVTKKQSYEANAVDMQVALAPVSPNKPGLNLITCDGKVTKNNEFTKRLIVFAQEL